VEQEVETRAEALRKRFSALERSRIALEAGTHSAWVARLLEERGHEVIVANPRRIPLLTRYSAKSDELDARTLARLARVDPQLLGPIQHRGERAQIHLLTVRSRAALVEARTKLLSAARGLTKAMGYRLPAAKTDAATPEILSGLPALVQKPLASLLEQVQSISEQIRKLDQQLEEIAATHYAQETAKLQQVKGVGPVIALTFVLTLESAERFCSSRAVGCYLGLRPKQRQSGQSNPQLRISKEGDSYLRSLLVQGAHCILGPHGEDCDLRRWGRKLCERGGKNARKRAVIAVARKLAVLLHRLWVGNEAYDPFYNAKRLKRAAMDACA
jgi:transposase